MQKNKIITVLGGTGFVGHHLAARLSSAGYQVRIPTRAREAHRDLLVLPGVQVIQANVHKPAELQMVLQGCDAVINLISILNERRSPQEKFETVNIDLVQNLIQQCEASEVSRLIHISALKADALEGPSEYLKTKGLAESLIAKSKLQSTVLRPSVIFGANDSFVNRFAKLLKMPAPWFFLPMPNTRFAPVYVEDVVSAILVALEDRDTINKTYSCCGPKIYSMRELILLIMRSMGLKRRVIGLNTFFSKIAATVLGVMPGKPFSKDNFLSMHVNSICDENGLEKLGISPQSMESVIPAYLKPRDHNSRFSDYRKSAGR
ncbi:MAG: complex I NDUFA9 subunit family protein [Gammaproteobacteria bacterium]|nr:complex I NDUFA9 subunit family protein [Gammaproteobacteria bacterium]